MFAFTKSNIHPEYISSCLNTGIGDFPFYEGNEYYSDPYFSRVYFYLYFILMLIISDVILVVLV